MSLKTKILPRKPKASGLPLELVSSLEAKSNAVKMTPGHGTAGRHATRAVLDMVDMLRFVDEINPLGD